MGFTCGIVGLPNVGKSTLFNALTQTQAAEAANYPFCTIEPNTGRVRVPDPRLEQLAGLAKSRRVVPTQLEFVDIAGLVQGASKGEGLGNRFLAHIREVDAICHVLRCFKDDNITHVDGAPDPVRDAETIETELMLADLESLERRQAGLARRLRSGDPEAAGDAAMCDRALALLQAGQPARQLQVTAEEAVVLKRLQLLTSKPVLYICNVGEDDAATGNAMTEAVIHMAAARNMQAALISAALEADVAALETEAERMEFLAAAGLAETGLSRVVRAGYGLLDLITFFTAGPEETRAWTIPAGTKAPLAAGAIHTDFTRGFICAETIAFADYIASGGEQGARDSGKLRQEGRDYVVRDGDVMHFRFNV